jgi:peroxiredoxin
MLTVITFTIFISAMMTAQNYRTAEEAKGLPVGIKAPDFSAVDQNGNVFKLSDQFRNGPVVIVFYRGYWCPVCDKHLGKLQDSLKLIEAAGAKVIAISPEKPEYLEKMADKTGAKFQLLYDDGYAIADAYDVTFKPGASTLLIYNTVLNANLKETHSDDSQRLPIPATYIIGQDGKIIWRQFDPDYKQRSTVKEILNVLRTN